MLNNINYTIAYKASDINEDQETTSSLREMINRVEKEPPVPMLYSVIKEGSVGLIYGVAKTGKTIFCENLGMSIASGRDSFLGKAINSENKKVLFISLEEFYHSRTERNIKQIRTFNKTERENVLNNYYVVNEKAPKVLSTKEDWMILTKAIEKHMPGVVFIDSLTRMIDGQVESSEIAKNAMLTIRDIAERYKVTICLIHHSTKIDDEKAMTLQNIAGSRVISQEADFILGINKTSNNSRYIKLVAARYANDNIDSVAKFELDENLWINITGIEKEFNLLNPVQDKRKNDDNLRKIMYKMKELSAERSLISTKELKSTLVDTNEMSEPTLHTNLKKGESKNLIFSPKKGYYTLALIASEVV